MKAIVQDEYGDSAVLHLDEVPVPTLKDDEVLIEVRATSLHIGDWHLMAGLPLLVRPAIGLKRPRQRIRGMDVAGIVHSVGPAVTAFAVGDEVFGVVEAGLAQYAVASVDKIVHKPAGLTFEQASAIPTSAATALHAVRDVGRIQPGQEVLVIGAAGGVGIYATQLAKALDGRVTGVCSTAKLDLVRSLGAEAVVDYTESDVTILGKRYDLIIDTAGNRPVASLRRILTSTGTLVIVGGEGGGRLAGTLSRQLVAPLRGVGSKQSFRGLVSVTRAADLVTLAELVEAGQLAPVIDEVYPLARAGAAMQRLETSAAVGKLVVVG
ncbi:NADPH:quinone reductase-like Zn-dependent oxidoreductase [Conyzicola nivalis]|uniref:NADPH:quinone reductase-like Zn-dependent oxidoreductase n=1 Tax=Conyzicola nivalis TaxID=1477021 RepID=A0ABV2QLP6_9MICO